MTVGVAAQDNTVKSRTKIKADEGRVVSMTGCLRQGASGTYTLIGHLAGGGDDLKTKTTVKTDVDRDDTKVKAKAKTSSDDGSVATTGAVSTFMLAPRDGVSLSQYVDKQVQLSAVMVDPDHKDADVKIKEKTTVDPDHAHDSTARGKAKVEVDRTSIGQYTVVSVTPLGAPCVP